MAVLLYYLLNTTGQEVPDSGGLADQGRRAHLLPACGTDQIGIAAGALSPGERLPSVRDLATEAGVNPNTMQRALQELERQGLVYSQRTSGRFVTEDREMIEAAKSALAAEQVRSFLDAMARLGYMRDDILRLIEARIKEENGNGEL